MDPGERLRRDDPDRNALVDGPARFDALQRVTYPSQLRPYRMLLAYLLLRSSALAALCAAVVALAGLGPATNGPEPLVRPARCGWQRVDSTYLATHVQEDTLPDSATVSATLREPTPLSGCAPPLARRSNRQQGATSWGILADGTAPISDAATPPRPTHLKAHGQHGPPRAGRAPPTT